ncbi:MAG: guanylate kinase [Candidatus Cyclobacteriaceae bacterium M3_2C_046]
MNTGKVLIFSAPSGSGKTTIVQHLLKHYPGLGFSISATTRSPRGHERDGKDYYFFQSDQFVQKIHKDEFVEWEEVYQGNYYGTLKSEIERLWQQGKHVVFDVDVKGGLNLKKYFGDKALAVFIRVSSSKILEQRLRGRKSDQEESIRQRIEKAEYENQFAPEFDVEIINDDLDTALNQVNLLIEQFIKKPVSDSINSLDKK